MLFSYNNVGNVYVYAVHVCVYVQGICMYMYNIVQPSMLLQLVLFWAACVSVLRHLFTRKKP